MLIIVHPGQAHRDDFLACAVALAVNDGMNQDIRIHRREPTEDELRDPNVMVLDVGGDFNPDILNFDHHQFERDHEPACALSLYAPTIDIGGINLDDALKMQKWYRPTVVLDSKGPFALANSMDTNSDNIFALMSPVEEALLDAFTCNTVIARDSNTPLYLMLYTVGRRIVDNAISLARRVQELNDEAKLIHCNDVPGIYLESDDLTGINEWREKRCPGTAFSVTYDDRGTGLTLYRFDDDTRIDFSKIADDDRVAFSHPGGFIAKTVDKLDLDAIHDLVSLALNTD